MQRPASPKFHFLLVNLPLTCYSEGSNEVAVVAATLATAEQRCGGSSSGSSGSANIKYI